MTALLFSLLIAAGSAPGPVGLAELQAIAVAHSPRLAAAKAAVQSAAADIDAAASARGPRVDVAGYGRVASPVDLPIPGQGGSVRVRQPLTGGAAVQVAQPLTEQYGISQAIRGAQAQREAAALRARGTEADLKAAVASAYYRHAAAAAAVDRARAEVAAAKAARDVVMNLKSKGIADQAAFLEAELKAATAEADEATSLSALEDGEGELEALLGAALPPGRPLSTELAAPAPLALPDGEVDRAAGELDDVKAARADAEAAARACAAADQELWPSLALTGEAGLSAGDALQPGQGASASLVLRWHVLDWGLAKAKRSATCSRAEAATDGAKEAELRARSALLQAVRADQAAARAHEARKKAHAQAEELARVVADKAAHGAATPAEVLSAAARLASAKADLATAAATWLSARAQTERVLGR